MNSSFIESFLLFVVLFNPFLMSIYLLQLINEMSPATFANVLLRASLISVCAFVLFALTGDAFFSKLLQVRFAAFQVFGGIIFLIISLQYMFQGPKALSQIKGGPPERVAGAVALPFMIGPGTISASVVTGSKLPWMWAIICIISAQAVSMAMLFGFKILHDWVRKRHESLVERYIEVTGRISALLIGTIAFEMVFTGLDSWLGKH